MTREPAGVFFSYSHRDENLRVQLENHLALLRRENVITGWHDRKIGIEYFKSRTARRQRLKQLEKARKGR